MLWSVVSGQWSVVSGQWAVSQVDSCKIVYINKNASFRVPPSCLVSCTAEHKIYNRNNYHNYSLATDTLER